MTHPCRSCKNKDIDKNNPECTECSLRINYIRKIAGSTGIDCDIVTIENKVIDNIKSNRHCIECGKPRIYAKGKCMQCYNRDLTRKRRKVNKTRRCKICGHIGIEAKGMCRKHYRKDIERRKALGTFKVRKRNICKTFGCGKPVIGNGYCRICYRRHYDKNFFNIRIGNEFKTSILSMAHRDNKTIKHTIERLIKIGLESLN